MARINTATGVRPDPKRYNDPLGVVTYHGTLGTRVARGKVLAYDGRLTAVPEPLAPMHKQKRSLHQIREIVKGVLARSPALQTAEAQDILRHVMVQLLADTTITDTTLVKICDQVPFQKVFAAIRDMRNRDGDIEDLTGDAWWTHKKIKPASANPKAVSEYRRRGWLTRARLAATLTESANVLRRELTDKLRKKAPVLACAVGNCLHVGVCASDFEAVEVADV